MVMIIMIILTTRKVKICQCSDTKVQILGISSRVNKQHSKPQCSPLFHVWSKKPRYFVLIYELPGIRVNDNDTINNRYNDKAYKTDDNDDDDDDDDNENDDDDDDDDGDGDGDNGDKGDGDGHGHGHGDGDVDDEW